MSHLTDCPSSDLPFVPMEEAWEFNEIRPDARERARRLHAVACRVHAAPKNKTAVYQECARELGLSFNAVYEPVKKFLLHTDWRHLIDRRAAGSKFWHTQHPTTHPQEFIKYWQGLVLDNQRAAAPAYAKLIDQLRKWRAGDQDSAIPGFIVPPPNAKGRKHPRKWSYKNLLRIQPEELDLIAARNGRAAAMKLMPHILTTRKGGWPCMEYQFDDMWHDFEVIHNMQICRLLEFNAIDYYSGFIFNPGLKPRFKNADGTNESLTEKQFRLWSVQMLATTGWSPRGTTLQGERGTAAFRALAPKLKHWSGGLLKIPLPGMSGAPAFVGGWNELAKGNPNAKALKEGMGKIIHNRLASLPGQVGMNPKDKPASSTGRDKEAEQLIALQRHIATPLHHTHLTFEQGAFEVVKTYMEINRRTEHEMEGWLEEGLFTQEYCADPTNDIWINIGELPDESRQAITIISASNPQFLRPRKLSPLEVISPALPHNIRLSPEAEADCLYEDCRRDCGVTNGKFSFEDKDYGVGKFRYIAEYKDRNGFTRLLPNDSEAQLVINPFNPERGFVYDMRGSYLGIVRRDHSVMRSDVDALHRKIGDKERRYKDAKLGSEIILAGKREGQMTHNTRAMLDSLEQNVLIKHGLAQPTNTSAEFSMDEEYSSADLTPQPANIAADSHGLI
jgi:hypothetical protein